MKNPEADKAQALAIVSLALRDAVRGKDADDDRTEDLRGNTVLAMSDLLDEFGLAATAGEVRTRWGEFGTVRACVSLERSRNLSITLFVLDNGKIELHSRRTYGDHIELSRHGFSIRETQVFYKHMLFLLDYEHSGAPVVRLHGPQRLRFHRLPRPSQMPWILASLGGSDRKRRTISVELSQKRAVDLCRVLAEPLGWELEI